MRQRCVLELGAGSSLCYGNEKCLLRDGESRQRRLEDSRDLPDCPTVVEDERLSKSTVLTISAVDGLWALHVRSRVS